MKKVSRKTYIVYLVTSPSNRCYVGITGECLSNRISKHKYSASRTLKQSKFSKCIIKYGIENLTWQILKCNLSQTLAKKYEIYFIKKLNTFKNGYNSTIGGEGNFGYKWNKNRFDEVHKIRTKKYYEQDWYKQKHSKIKKEYMKRNPDKAKETINKLMSYIKNNNSEWREKVNKALRSPKVRLKNSIRNGGKPFNVYDYMKKTYINTYEMQADCNKDLNIHNGKIASCLNGKRTQSNGYIFKYRDDSSVIDKEFNLDWLKNIKRRPNGCKSE